jgi:hypothetical protein
MPYYAPGQAGPLAVSDLRSRFLAWSCQPFRSTGGLERSPRWDSSVRTRLSAESGEVQSGFGTRLFLFVSDTRSRGSSECLVSPPNNSKAGEDKFNTRRCMSATPSTSTWTHPRPMEFCGHSGEGWGPQSSLRSFDLTPCFERTVFFSIPSAFLVLFGILWILKLRRRAILIRGSASRRFSQTKVVSRLFCGALCSPVSILILWGLLGEIRNTLFALSSV